MSLWLSIIFSLFGITGLILAVFAGFFLSSVFLGSLLSFTSPLLSLFNILFDFVFPIDLIFLLYSFLSLCVPSQNKFGFTIKSIFWSCSAIFLYKTSNSSDRGL